MFIIPGAAWAALSLAHSLATTSAKKPLLHEEGAPFSGAIIDPIETHHAHIENEQRLNLGTIQGLRSVNGRRNATESSVEVATTWTKQFRFGSEVRIPFSNTGDASGKFEVGDIEFWPVKYSFLAKPDEIATIYINSVLPTGSVSRGFGQGSLGLGTILLYDRAFGNVFWGTNLEYLSNVTGSKGASFEYATVLAYSWIKDTPRGGVAPPSPKQRGVFSASLEYVHSRVLSGLDANTNEGLVTPAIHYWDVRSGWQFHLGVRIPVSGDREFDRAIVFQFGNHFNWGRLFGAKEDHDGGGDSLRANGYGHGLNQ